MSCALSAEPDAPVKMMQTSSTSSMPVIHLVDAAGGDNELWGKERVILWLMEEQKRSNAISPTLCTLTPKKLNRAATEHHIDSLSLLPHATKRLRPFLRALKPLLQRRPEAVLHTHGYKANLLGRMARILCYPMGGLVSTCHGWIESPWSLRMYNAIDRWTARTSDVVTVPAPAMLNRLPRGALFVPNGIPSRLPAKERERRACRERFGWPDDVIVAGSLGRLSQEKGVDVFIQAAEATKSIHHLHWAIAGVGPLKDELRAAAKSNPRLHPIGYVEGADAFLPAIDIFVQPSWSEGLSLALLEAAREALPIVATRVGATDWALRDNLEVLLVEPGDATGLAKSVSKLAADARLREELGQAARARFENALDVSAMHERYLEIYRSIAARRKPR